MPQRLKSMLVLSVVIPALFLLVSLGGSLPLYYYTVATSRNRLALFQQEEALKTNLQATRNDRQALLGWTKTLEDYYQTASIDGFISALLNSSKLKPELTASASVQPSLIKGLSARAAQQLTLLGCTNSLIASLGQAQMAYPSIIPIQWELKTHPRWPALQFEARFVVPMLSEFSLSSPSIQTPLRKP